MKGNEILKETYYDTNTALFPSHTLSRHIYAKTHLVKHCDYAGRVYARRLGHKLGHLAPTATIGILL